jgi:hypothetical protein
MTAVRGQRLDPGVRVRRRISFAALRMTSKAKRGADGLEVVPTRDETEKG